MNEKKTDQVEKIVLFGHRVHIHADKVEIFNDQSVPFYDFKPIASRLMQYLVDEMFIEKKKIRTEIVTPEAAI